MEGAELSRLSLYVSKSGRSVLHYSGFSFLAAIFPVVWALHRRLYGIAALALVYAIALGVLIGGWPPAVQALVIVAQVVLFGFTANRLHAFLLERRGWVLTASELPQAGEGEG